MQFSDVEVVFNRAFSLAFSKLKFLFTFPVLMICGVLIVFCRALSIESNPWVWMSFVFLPVFLCTGILLTAGVLLSRIYYHEVKGLPFKFQKLLSQSFQLLIGVSYLSLPLILSYLLLWTLMGVFHLLKGLPGLGEIVGVLLSFGPFLLVLGSLALSFVSLLILHFVTPHVSLKNSVHFHIAEEIIDRLQHSLFANLTMLMVGILPLLFVVGFLSFGAWLTGFNFFSAKEALSVSLQWFFMMVPFCLILTPFVIFFFNFATESYVLLRRQRKKDNAVQPTKPNKESEKEEVCPV